MKISTNISLKPFNTFRLGVSAKYFAPFSSIELLLQLLQEFKTLSPESGLMVLGGGSNVLFTGNFEGLVLRNEIKGIELIKEDPHHVFIKAGAGKNWHEFVQYCIDHDWAGIENLSLIPGSVGASPMQNIGAYGVEIKDVFESLDALDLSTYKVVSFSANDCAFGYRESIFKKELNGKFIILHVILRLDKIPEFNTSYGAIEQELEKMKVGKLSIRAISQAVINIRNSKLPDPAIIGNAGSYFKNPEIGTEQFRTLKSKFPGLIGFPVNDNMTKVAAGWLIEQCGWKGYRKGDAGCHEKQALVLVNYGNATGQEIFDLGEMIRESVRQKFEIDLEREVNVF